MSYDYKVLPSAEAVDRRLSLIDENKNLLEYPYEKALPEGFTDVGDGSILTSGAYNKQSFDLNDCLLAAGTYIVSLAITDIIEEPTIITGFSLKVIDKNTKKDYTDTTPQNDGKKTFYTFTLDTESTVVVSLEIPGNVITGLLIKPQLEKDTADGKPSDWVPNMDKIGTYVDRRFNSTNTKIKVLDNKVKGLAADDIAYGVNFTVSGALNNRPTRDEVTVAINEIQTTVFGTDEKGTGGLKGDVIQNAANITKIQAFFDGAAEDSQGLNNALDKLVDIQNYLNGDGSATNGLLGQVNTNTSDITTLKTNAVSSVTQEGSGVVKSVKKNGTEIKVTRSAVAAGDIADEAITGNKIVAAAVTTAKLSDSAVTTAKIEDNNVTDDKIKSVSASKVIVTAKSGSITEDETLADRLADIAELLSCIEIIKS